jgi:hypothetical protein
LSVRGLLERVPAFVEEMKPMFSLQVVKLQLPLVKS